MTIDYSKFDNIEDSDEEREAQEKAKFSAPAPAPAPTGAGRGGGYSSELVPAAPVAKQEKRVGRSGHELLEASGFESTELGTLVAPQSGAGGKGGGKGDGGQPDMMHMMQELERLAAGGGSPGQPGGAVEEPHKPGEPKVMCVRGDGRKKNAHDLSRRR